MADLRMSVRKYVQRTQSPERLRHEAAIRDAVDPAGRLADRVARPFRTPIDLQWGSGNTRPQALARPGRAVLIRARCDTAPSGGPCVVTLTWESETVGWTHLGEVRIQAGQRHGSVTIDPEIATLPEGAWIKAGSPSPANGATGVDVELTVDLI